MANRGEGEGIFINVGRRGFKMPVLCKLCASSGAAGALTPRGAGPEYFAGRRPRRGRGLKIYPGRGPRRGRGR